MLGQRATVDELHHDVVDAAIVFDFVDRADVRMIERRRGTRFLSEAAKHVGVGGDRTRQHLDGHRARQPCVQSAVDTSKAARADKALDFVGAEAVTWLE